ncbi:electron transfer flavoprotein subunit alpha/FixB family protein [Sulfolobus tengchongensis]|uniref:Electron transfer flavoprotein subunit alpha/FixB family protein n=1 Tax=Sulfolobus tengchongensis TaxID=207809 RepID=A0AAX4KX80_9CREN
MKTVVFSENPVFLRMASAVAQSLGGEVIGISNNADVKVVNKLYVIDKLDEDGIVDLIASLSPDVIITGNVRRDRAIAGRIAGRLKLPIVTDVISFKLEGKKIVADRVAYSGMGVVTVEGELPIVITIANTQLQPKELQPSVEKVQLKEGRVKVVSRKSTSSGSNLSTAQIVVGVGRGIGSKENVKYAEELANALGGVVGGSRPVAAELNWVPEDRQIGLSGLRIRPKLYIALGISGQPQHIAGIRDSKIIVAVNTDKNAPILENADYLVVADAVAFCKAMLNKLGKQ